MWDIVWVSPQGHSSVSESPFPSAGIAVSLFRAKTVQQRPLLPREVKTPKTLTLSVTLTHRGLFWSVVVNSQTAQQTSAVNVVQRC